MDPNVPPQARYPDNYVQNPMEQNFQQPRARERPPMQYEPPNQYPPHGPPQPLPRELDQRDLRERGRALHKPDGIPVFQDPTRDQGHRILEREYSKSKPNVRESQYINESPFSLPKREDWYGNQGKRSQLYSAKEG